MSIKTHKTSGWTRESLRDSSPRFRITPTDDSGDRIVAMMSAGSWANYPQDDRELQDQDRVVLLEGAPLPEWALAWLNAANAKANARARENFRAAVERADFDADMRDSQSY